MRIDLTSEFDIGDQVHVLEDRYSYFAVVTGIEIKLFAVGVEGIAHALARTPVLGYRVKAAGWKNDRYPLAERMTLVKRYAPEVPRG